MTDQRHAPDEHGVSLAQLAADDALLDALAAGEPGEPGAEDDAAARLLAAWHADLSAAIAEPAAELAAEAPASLAERRVRRFGPVRKAVAGIAAAVVIASGLAIGAHGARPGNPLFPITEVVYRQQAEARSAEHAIAQATAALDAGEAAAARRLLGVAAGHLAKIDDEQVRARLQGEIDALQRRLETRAAGPTPGPTGGPFAPGPTTRPPAKPAPSGTGKPAGGGSTGGGSTGGGSSGGGSDSGGGSSGGSTGGGSEGGGLPLPLPLPSLPLPTLPPILPSILGAPPGD